MQTRRPGMAAAMAAAVAATAICADVLLSACGGPFVTQPTFSEERVTVTITENGVSPAFVTVPVCRSSGGCFFYLQFVNRDSQSHDMKSDPHPTHTDCPSFNTAVGIIATGQTKEWDITNCPTQFTGYHDETRPDDARFRGRVSWAR